MITVLRSGAHTTVQDLGRPGWQRAGVPVGGAMDDVALRVANLLAGNAPGAAALEATLNGPTLRFEADAYVAIAGADMGARLDGVRLPPWWGAPVRAGATLALDSALAGCRTYIAVGGGIDAPVILGSRATYARARFGAVLESGASLAIGTSRLHAVACRRGVAVADLDLQRASVRFVAGPHLAALDAASREALAGAAFALAPDSDRMGLRFAGPPLAAPGAGEQLSAPVTMGTMQLPPGGAPIVLMADRQTTGGYPRLGEIASVDLPVLAQLRPGDSVRFEEVGIHAAERLYMERERAVDSLRRFLLHPC